MRWRRRGLAEREDGLGDDLALAGKPQLLFLLLDPVQDTKLVHGVVIEDPVHDKGRIALVIDVSLVDHVGDPLGAAEEDGPAL